MKTRRTFIRRLGGITALLSMGSLARARERSNETQGSFFHVVFFWLINDTEEVSRKFEQEVRQYTSQIDVIRTIHIGTPADTDRDVIDNTWSYSLILTFDSKKDQDIYQDHQAHLTFIENASSLWDKVLVYDSIQAS
jgi:hypothetical protein